MFETLLLGRSSATGLANRLDGFWTRLGNQDNGAALVAKMPAHLIRQVFLVLFREEFLPIDE
jgi:hypothetical protein